MLEGRVGKPLAAPPSGSPVRSRVRPAGRPTTTRTTPLAHRPPPHAARSGARPSRGAATSVERASAWRWLSVDAAASACPAAGRPPWPAARPPGGGPRARPVDGKCGHGRSAPSRPCCVMCACGRWRARARVPFLADRCRGIAGRVVCVRGGRGHMWATCGRRPAGIPCRYARAGPAALVLLATMAAVWRSGTRHRCRQHPWAAHACSCSCASRENEPDLARTLPLGGGRFVLCRVPPLLLHRKEHAHAGGPRSFSGRLLSREITPWHHFRVVGVQQCAPGATGTAGRRYSCTNTSATRTHE